MNQSSEVQRTEKKIKVFPRKDCSGNIERNCELITSHLQSSGNAMLPSSAVRDIIFITETHMNDPKHCKYYWVSPLRPILDSFCHGCCGVICVNCLYTGIFGEDVYLTSVALVCILSHLEMETI